MEIVESLELRNIVLFFVVSGIFEHIGGYVGFLVFLI